MYENDKSHCQKRDNLCHVISALRAQKRSISAQKDTYTAAVGGLQGPAYELNKDNSKRVDLDAIPAGPDPCLPQICKSIPG